MHARCIGSSSIEEVYQDVSVEQYSFELNLNGCPLLDMYTTNKVMNGATLKFASQDLQGKRTNGVPRIMSKSTGLVVAASDWRWTSHSVRFLSDSMTTRETMTFDYRPPWPWYLENVLVWFLLGIGLAGAGASGMYCTASTMQKATTGGCFLIAVINTIAMSGYTSLGRFREACFAAAQTSLWIFALLAFILTSGFLEEVLLILGAAALLARGVSDCLVFRDCENLTATPPAVELAMLFLGCFLVACKYQQLVAIVRRMGPEKARYDAAWQQILVRDGAAAELRRLKETTLRAAGSPFAHRALW